MAVKWGKHWGGLRDTVVFISAQTGPFVSYPFYIDWVKADSELARLLPKGSISDLIGKQGRSKSRDSLGRPHDVATVAYRLGLYLCRELEEHGYTENSEAWDLKIPGPVNPSVVEGVCGRLKYHWNRANSPQTGNEILRAMCVLSSTTLVPRAELWRADFRRWCVSRTRTIEGGAARNGREADARLEELEAGHRKRKRAKSKKRKIAARRCKAVLAVRKADLEALPLWPDLHDQCYLRSMTTHHKGWQTLGKEDIIKLCLKHKHRTAFMPGVALSDMSETDGACSDTELDRAEEEGSSSGEDSSSEPQPPSREKARRR